MEFVYFSPALRINTRGTNMIGYLIKPGSVCTDLRLRERSLRYVSLQAPIVVASYAVN